MLCHFLLTSMVSDEKLDIIQNYFSIIGKLSFLSGYFQDFSLPLVFRSLTMMNIDMDFFGLSCLGFYQLLESIGLCLCHIWKTFSHIYLNIF